MRRMSWIGPAVAIALALGGSQRIGARIDHDDERSQRPCGLETLDGDYGIQLQGTRPAGGGQFESVIGVVRRTYDGHGSFTQVSNVHGSINGTVPDLESFGTYDVNPDCTAATHETVGTLRIESRLVIVHGGREVFASVVSPLPSMVNAIQKKIDGR